MEHMAPELTLPQRVAAEIRSEMGWQNKRIPELASALNIESRAAKARYDGTREYTLDEIPTVAAWLGVSVTQLTTGVRDREKVTAA